MSWTGRMQDAVREILEGYEERFGEYKKGPMYGHPELSETVEKLVGLIYRQTTDAAQKAIQRFEEIVVERVDDGNTNEQSQPNIR